MRKRIFIILSAIMLIALGLAIVYFKNPNEGVGLIPCPIYLVTGLYCPGCGAARSIHSLLHMDFYKAFRYNPVLIIMLPFISAYLIAFAISYIKTGKDMISRKLSYKLVYYILIIILIYGVLRNIPFVPFSFLAPI